MSQNTTKTATSTKATTSEMCEAIRKDVLVGEGTCTNISECFLGQDMTDLVDMLEMDEVSTVEGAIEWARNYEDLLLENTCNYREGEEDDEQLTTLDAFRTARAALKGQNYGPWVDENRNGLYRYGLSQIGYGASIFDLAVGGWGGPLNPAPRHIGATGNQDANIGVFSGIYGFKTPLGWEAV